MVSERERPPRGGAPRIVGSAGTPAPATPTARSFNSVISAPSLPASKGRGKGKGPDRRRRSTRWPQRAAPLPAGGCGRTVGCGVGEGTAPGRTPQRPNEGGRGSGSARRCRLEAPKPPAPAAPTARSFGSPSLRRHPCRGRAGEGAGGAGPAATIAAKTAARRFAVSGRRGPRCRVGCRFRNRSRTNAATPERGGTRPRGAAPGIVGSAGVHAPATPTARSFGSVISAPSLPGRTGEGRGGAGPAATTAMVPCASSPPPCGWGGRAAGCVVGCGPRPDEPRGARTREDAAPGAPAGARLKRRGPCTRCADSEIVRFSVIAAPSLPRSNGRRSGRWPDRWRRSTRGPSCAASPSAGGREAPPGVGAEPAPDDHRGARTREASGPGRDSGNRRGRRGRRSDSPGGETARLRHRVVPGGVDAAVPAATAANPRSRGSPGRPQSRGAG